MYGHYYGHVWSPLYEHRVPVKKIQVALAIKTGEDQPILRITRSAIYDI